MFDFKELMVPGFKYIANSSSQLRQMADMIFSDKSVEVDLEFERAQKILIGDRYFPAALEAAKLVLTL